MDLNKITNLSNSVVIYNPVLGDSIVDQSEAKVKDFIFDKKTKYLITVSRIAEERNIIELINIFYLLPDKNNIKLLIIGDGKFLYYLLNQENLDIGILNYIRNGISLNYNSQRIYYLIKLISN